MTHRRKNERRNRHIPSLMLDDLSFQRLAKGVASKERIPRGYLQPIHRHPYCVKLVFFLRKSMKDKSEMVIERRKLCGHLGLTVECTGGQLVQIFPMD